MGNGTEYVRNSSKPFHETRKFVHKLGLKSRKEWQKYCKAGKKPDDIPVAPNSAYKKEWKGWGDFLGTGFVAYFNRKYKTFNQSRKFARSLKLKSIVEWTKYCKAGRKPVDIPSAPGGPGTPAGPVAPVAPVGPIGPVGPTNPIGPGGPVGSSISPHEQVLHASFVSPVNTPIISAMFLSLYWCRYKLC